LHLSSATGDKRLMIPFHFPGLHVDL
jgi:hypothetical protein